MSLQSKETIGLLGFMPIVSLIITGLFNVGEITQWLNYKASYSLHPLMNQWLAASFLALGILLLQLNRSPRYIYNIYLKLGLALLLVVGSVVLVHYTARWSLKIVSEERYWQMINNGWIIYYNSVCHVLGVLLLATISYLLLNYFKELATNQDSQPVWWVAILSFAVLLTGLALYHGNGLLKPLTFSMIITFHLSSSIGIFLLYMIFFMLIIVINVCVAFQYRKKIIEQPSYLLPIAIMSWCLTGLVAETLRLLFSRLSVYLGNVACVIFFYLTIFIIAGLTFYLVFNKGIVNKK